MTRPARVPPLAVLALVALSVGCIQTDVKPDIKVDTAVSGYPEPTDPTGVTEFAMPEPRPPMIIINGGKSTLIYYCRVSHCEMLRDAIESFLSPEGIVEAVPKLNRVLVNDSRDQVPGLLKVLQDLDQPAPQVLVESRVVEITLDSDREYELSHIFENVAGGSSLLQDSEIKLETPGASPTPSMGLRLTVRSLAGDYTLDHFIRLLVTAGNAQILSSPNIIVATGNQASIVTGEDVPIQSATVVSGSVSTTTIFKRVGIKLYVTPLQVTDDMARLDINPEVSAVTGYTSAGEAGVSNPIVAVRSVRTTLSVKDGELLTIGGLLRSERHGIVRKVPVLGDVPGVGWLFRSTRDSEVKTMLVFFLRVKILNEGRQGGFVMHVPGSGLAKLDKAVEQALPPLGQDVAAGAEEAAAPKAASAPPPLPSYAPLEPIIVDMTPAEPEPEPAAQPEGTGGTE
jgi:general secretion pathway protein D